MKTVFIAFLLSSKLISAPYQPIQIEEIKEKKKASCVLFHVWATWCDYCIEELPALLKKLENQKQLKPIVIDTSAKTERDKFSKAFIEKQKISSTTYFYQGASEEMLIKELDPKWSGALPFNALYHKGKILKTWVGQAEAEEMIRYGKTNCH